ncbi:putative sporulation protein YtxC [Wansuia hejianensis]|uniref:Sporulation protein YtxC n=1 Tax=Wansuia hejianensis TaxID=2763667 RepID=A0A926INB7_9FIRM|nr:putative sporulation protein YtxC [Wansuia hejianensis]MBC8591285.1 putative sporulation protein YtxC [Wansuia hejianensis]
MEPIKIGSTIPAEKITSVIEKIPFKKRININYEEYKDRFMYSFSLGKRRTNEDIILFNIMANFVQDMIIKFYTEDLIYERINQVLRDTNTLDKNKIAEDVYKLILDKNLFVKEKEILNNEILDYLMESNTLIIDGYLTFRPNSFNLIIDKAIEIVMGEIQLEIEYNEFIGMLQFFVDTQPPEIDKVNVIIKEGEFKLLDSHYREIDNEYIATTLQDIFYDDVTKSDILLSTLIALAPSSMVIHVSNDMEKELVDILKEVFRDRAKICEGCSMCELEKIEKKD